METLSRRLVPRGRRQPGVNAARLTPGGRWLYDQGLRVVDLAALLGCSGGQISHYLGGRTIAPPRLFAAVEVLRGSEAADELSRILEEAKTTKP